MMRRKLGTGKLWMLTGALAIVAAIAMSGIYMYSRQESEKELAQNQTRLESTQTAKAEQNSSSGQKSLGTGSEGTLDQEEKENKTPSTDKTQGTDKTQKEGTDEENVHPESAEPAENEADATGTDDTSNVAAMIEANKAAETADTTKTEEAQAAQSNAVSEYHFSADSSLSWPLAGNVLMDYSMDATVYYATLQQYKYNPAMIIQGEVNSKVTAAASGVIAEIVTNEETGCTVTMDIGDGYTAIYGQLKELSYEQGDYVEAGALLGHVSEPTKYYSVEGSNLYFELMKDGVPVDPMDYLQ